MKLKNIALGKVFATVLLASGLAFSGAAYAALTELGDYFEEIGVSNNVNSPASPDEKWVVNATGSVERNLKLSSACTGCTFGIYDVTNTSKTLELMTSAWAIGATQSFSAASSGTGYVFSTGGMTPTSETFATKEFGYYVEYGGVYYYSQASKNASGQDAMLAFLGNGSDQITVGGSNWGLFNTDDYILAWEVTGDANFFDWLVLVESVTPVTPGVPEPGTFAMLGVGLVGLGAIRRRRA
jgi:hypothetical protein